jgi:hypothetical protein
MVDERPKLTRTTRHLMGTTPSRGFDGIAPVPSETPLDPNFILRLNWAVTPKRNYDSERVCESIERAPSDVSFFCDTSMFDVQTDDRLWPALLNHPGKLVLTPRVQLELKPWLQSHPDHIAARAMRERHEGIRFLKNQYDEVQLACYVYYMNLLGVRKRLLKLGRVKFNEAHGRDPNERELAAIRNDAQRTWGERAALLANKGDRPVTPTYFTDEEVVYSAVINGIASGRPTAILTKDEDLQEQFYKLIWLLDTHYRGMLLAGLYAREFSRFTMHPLPLFLPDVRDAFEEENGLLIERSAALIEEEVLPQTFHFVALECWVMGARLTRAIFAAEQEMARVLHTKGITRGLNTDVLGGRNCHIWLAPLSIPHELRGCAAIVRDRRVKVGSTSVQIPLLDANQAIFCGERFKRLIRGGIVQPIFGTTAQLMGLTIPR